MSKAPESTSNTRELTDHEKQLAYAKKHQEKINEYVLHHGLGRIESVQINWEQTKWEPAPFIGPESMILAGTVNGWEDSSWYLSIVIGDDDKPDMKKKTLLSITLGDDVIWDDWNHHFL